MGVVGIMGGVVVYVFMIGNFSGLVLVVVLFVSVNVGVCVMMNFKILKLVV